MSALVAAEDSVYRQLDRLTDRRAWLWWVVATSAAVSLFVAFPYYGQVEHFETWNAVLLQEAHPFRYHPYGPGTHESKLAFRLLVPLVGGRLGLDRWGYLVLQALVGVALLGAFARLCWQVTADRAVSAMLTVAFASCWAGSTAFVEVRGTFDAVALALLTLAALTTSALRGCHRSGRGGVPVPRSDRSVVGGPSRPGQSRRAWSPRVRRS